MPCGSSKGNSNHDENNHCAFEDLDHSVLQQPLNLGVTNVKQILRCIQSGSKEVKDIILNECNIIYECKVCDGLFRSLANFLYHKRCYCKKHLCEDMLLFENFDEEIITVNPEPPLKNKEKAENFPEIPRLADCTVNLENMEFESVEKSSNPNSSKGKNGSSSQDIEAEDKTESCMISRRTRNKNALTSIKVISTEEPPLKCTNMISARIIRKDSNEKKNVQEKKDDKDGKTKRITITKFPDSKKPKESPFPKVIFKAIDSNPHAVYQGSVSKKAGSTSSSTKAKNGKEKVLIVTKQDAKVKNPKANSSRSIKKFEKINEFLLTRRKRLLARKDCDLTELRCLTCNTQFMSVKTLYFHMLSLHSKKRLYYPCPFCETLFVQMYGVSRHLMTIHNRNKEQISKLREIIKKRSVWKKIEDVQPGFVGIYNHEIKPEIKEEKDEKSMSSANATSSQPEEGANYSQPAENATVSQPVENATVSQPAENATVSQPGENTTVSQPEEGATYAQPAESATTSQPTKIVVNSKFVESATQSKPVEVVTHTKPIEISECNPMVESKSIEKQAVSNMLYKQPDVSAALHSCGKCGRVFGRKSSQVSHEKFCIMNTLIKKENVDDPPAVSSLSLISSPVLSFVATPQKQAPPTPVKQNAHIPSMQGIPAPQKQESPALERKVTPVAQKEIILAPVKQPTQAPVKHSTPASEKQVTPTPQKQSAQAPRKQANPKATCVLHISAPGATPAPKSMKSENNPVNKPAIEMPVNMFNVKLSTRPKRGAEKQMHKDFVNSQTLKWRSANRVDTSARNKAHVPAKKDSGKNLEKTVLSFINSANLTCLKCKKKFSSYSNLRRHVAIHVGWTRFKCKYCDYQAYNKSQCWSHVQKCHSVEDEEVEKYIVFLTNCGRTKKSGPRKNVGSGKHADVSENYEPCSTKALKRKAVHTQNNGSSKKLNQARQESDPKQEQAESDFEEHDIKTAATPTKVAKKSLPQMKINKAPALITLTKVAHKDVSGAKTKSPATITIKKIPIQEPEGGRKDRKQYVIPLQQVPSPDHKKESYRTMTTSKPTTIILSKSISCKAAQPVEAEPAGKTSPTRTSPRRPENKVVEEKITTSTAARPLENTKLTPLHPKTQGLSDSADKASQDPKASSCPKKQKLVSEWFPKKEGRRDSAPLIIGLVPASNSQAKNSTEADNSEGEK